MIFYGQKTITKNISFEYRSYGIKDPKYLMCFLHPAGVDSSALEHIYKNLLEKNQEKYGFELIMPFVCNDIFNPDSVKLAIEDRLDIIGQPSLPVIVCGYSMGARGTWDFAFSYPKVAKAIIPVAGYGCYLRSQLICDLPALIIHGSLDNVIPISESKKMHSTTKLSDLWIFETDHTGISEVFCYDELYQWIEQHIS